MQRHQATAASPPSPSPPAAQRSAPAQRVVEEHGAVLVVLVPLEAVVRVHHKQVRRQPHFARLTELRQSRRQRTEVQKVAERLVGWVGGHSGGKKCAAGAAQAKRAAQCWRKVAAKEPPVSPSCKTPELLETRVALLPPQPPPPRWPTLVTHSARAAAWALLQRPLLPALPSSLLSLLYLFLLLRRRCAGRLPAAPPRGPLSMSPRGPSAAHAAASPPTSLVVQMERWM